MARHFIRRAQDIEGAVKALSLFNRLAHDTETFGPPGIGGLHPFHGSRAYAHVFATDQDEFYFDFNVGGISREHVGQLAPLFSDSKRLIFYVNAIFDNCMLHMDGIKNLCRIADVPALARIEYSRHGKDDFSDESFLGLDYLAQHYLKRRKNEELSKYIEKFDLYEKDTLGKHIKDNIQGRDIPLFNEVPFDISANYACDDARITYDLGRTVVSRINGKDTEMQGRMIEVARNEISLTSVVLDMKVEGLKVWVPYVERAITHEQAVSARALLEVEKSAPGVNTNSSAQLGAFLESKGVVVSRGNPPPGMLGRALRNEEKARDLHAQINAGDLTEKKTKSLASKLAAVQLAAAKAYAGNYLLDAQELERLAAKYTLPFLKNVVGYKRAQKKISTYYTNFLHLRDSQDIIHCGLHQETAKTGRFSSSAPNLQNLHKEKWNPDWDLVEPMLIRRSFIAQGADEILLFADYKQQEMMVMLDQAEEMDVIQLLLSGAFDDFYLATNAIIKRFTGKELTRQQAKAIALGLAYGQGKALLAHGLGVSLMEAEGIKTAFFRALGRLQTFDASLKRHARVHGYIKNPFGRVTYIPRDKDYTALNAYVQGTSADITKMAMVRLGHPQTGRLVREGFKSKIALCVHDELIFRVKENELSRITPVIREEMSAAYPHKHLQLGVDFEISYRNKSGVSAWGEKVSYDH